VGRAVVWLLLVALAGEITLEATSRLGYSRTLAALLDRLAADEAAGRTMTTAQAAGLIAGWPASSEQKAGAGKQTEYRWRSFLWDLRLQLQQSGDGNILAVTIGREGLPPPKKPSPVLAETPTPAPPRPHDLQGLAATSTPLVALELKGSGFGPHSVEHGHLLRELARQAFLIAARDELGLATRDRLLGEPLPDDENAVLPVLGISMSIYGERRVDVIVSREFRDGTENDLAVHRFQLPAGPLLDRLAAKAEALSTDEFLAALKKLGFTGKGHEYLAEGAVGQDTELVLQEYDALSQLAGVRALHRKIHESGESPERLAALATAYARLGTLTQFLWSPAYKIFAARGLLYAERLMRRTYGNAPALWTRGHVRALVGLHASALEDFAKARKAGGGAAVPGWADPLEAFCRGDLARLTALAGDERHKSLASYLHLLAAGPSANMSVRLKAAARLLQAEPDCLMAMDVMADHAPLGVERQVNETAFSRYSEALKQHLDSTADVPEDARRAGEEGTGELQSLVDSRARVVAALRAANTTRALVEPSFAVLASVIDETTFVHAVRLLNLERNALAVDTSAELAVLRPALKQHRYAQLIDSFDNDDGARQEALTTVIRTFDKDFLELPACKIFEYFDKDQIAPYGDATVRHCDRIYGDLARTLTIPASESVKREAALALFEVSPGSPVGIAALIVHDWEKAEPSAAAWDERFKDDAGVMGALAEKYTALKRHDDAVRCRRQQIEIDPAQDAFRALATLYREHGDEQLWFDTLTRSLEAPSFGLEHAHSHSDLAYYHMRRREWNEARPHADQAAASYSGWGLLCAAEFYERTGDWRRAELFHRLTAERYESSELDWYRWCRRTGRGNVAAARVLAQKWIARQKKLPTAEGLDTVAMYYVLENQPAQALEEFRAAAALQGGDAYHVVHAALLADELGNAALRDELLKEAHRRGATQNGYMVAIISAFQNCLEAGIEQFDRPAVDWAIRDRSAPGHPTNNFYFVGEFLALHGREAEAREYFEDAATSSAWGKFNSTMAAYALLKAGAEIGPRRDSEFDDETTAKIERVREANKLYDDGEWDKALGIYTALIEAHPDFADAWYLRGSGLMEHDELEKALHDLTRAHELIPRCPRFLERRGQTYEYLGRYADAVADYEAALALDPRNSLARYNLAFLRAACPEPAFRDGPQAQEHARKVLDLPEVQRFLALALLAAAEAEAGDFDEAARHQAESLRLAPPDTREMFNERLQMYYRHEPYHRRPEWWKKR
jgi:tetratricopeptide (TPR) repeat protein